MKRFSPGEIIDGKVKMVEREDGDFVLAVRHEQAIAAAVTAERRRVWGEIEGQIKMAYRESKKEIPYGDSYQSDKAAIMEALLLRLFPNGEPTAEDSSADQTNPPAGERRGSE